MESYRRYALGTGICSVFSAFPFLVCLHSPHRVYPKLQSVGIIFCFSEKPGYPLSIGTARFSGQEGILKWI